MNFIDKTSTRILGFGLLLLLVTIPMIYAERPQQSSRAESAPRSAPPARASAPRAAPVQHAATVDRSYHGTIRHVDTPVVERPENGHGNFENHQHVSIHRDVDVDVGRSRFWHGFSYGARSRGLRAGYVSLYVGGSPFFYDDGIYYQQSGTDYQEVYPPVGAAIAGLPDGAVEVDAGGIIYYYVGGAFYVQQGNGGFVIVAPPMGVTVSELPPGAAQVAVTGGGMAYQFNGFYYRPVFVNGVTQYTTFTP